MAETYLGNPNLKKSNVAIEWTPYELSEYVKCSKDQVYFIKNYCKIVNVDRGLIHFELWDFQEKMVKTFESNRYTICKMPRQVGKTTTVAAYMLWKILFTENFNVAILANKMMQAREILSRIQLMFEYLPKYMQMGVKEWNKGNIELENGSKILAAATSSSAVRGGSFNLIYLDEFAFVPSNIQEEFFASVYPTISSGKSSKVVITSTPNGLNLFYKLWVDSEEGRNTYARVDVHWSNVPDRDHNWMVEQVKNTSEEQFRVEFECEFLGSSMTLIHPAKLRSLVFRPPITQQENINIYHQPSQNELYTIVVDTSRGSGGDYSAFVVFKAKPPYEVCAVYRNNMISPLLYPNIIYSAAKFYNSAMVLVETNDIGQQVADILHHDLEYEYIMFTTNNGRDGQTLSGGFNGSLHFGVRTTKQVKRIGCANLKTLIEKDQLIINDYETIQELSRFSQKGTSYEAEEGHDDLVMCCVLFAWLTAQPYFKEVTDVDIRQILYDENQKMLDDQMLPFGIYDDGIEEEAKPWTVDF